MKDYAVKVENISKIYELKNKNNQYKKDNCKQFSLEAPVIPATQTYIQPFAR